MTLVANVEGTYTDLSCVSDAEWDLMHRKWKLDAPSRRDIRCLGCSGRMYTKEVPTSPDPHTDAPRVLRMFCHWPGAAQACHALGLGESPEHHELKLKVAMAVRAAGWTAQPEVRHEDLSQSDVVATKKGKEAAWGFEIQLAQMTEATAIQRTSRYLRHVGHVAWLHTDRRTWANHVPSLRLDASRTHVIDSVFTDNHFDTYEAPQPVEDVIGAILAEDIWYIYLADWGGFVRRRNGTHAGGKAAAPRKRAKPVPNQVRRHCARLRTLDQFEDVIDAAGLGPLDRFAADRVAALRRFQNGGCNAWTAHDRDVLALAGSLYGAFTDTARYLAEFEGGTVIPNTDKGS